MNKLVDYNVYYINLDERTDRNKHILNELINIFPKENINRIPAHKHVCGAVGCTQSHVNVLIQFLKSEKEHCFVFEDDFQFLYPKDDIMNIIMNVLKDSYNVIMLSYNSLGIDLDLSSINNNLCKMKNGRTTAGYIVNKKYAKILLNNYIEGLQGLMTTLDKPKYSVDMHWMKLQNDFRACVPCLGTQMSSYSDIENRPIDYIQCNTCIVVTTIDQDLKMCPFLCFKCDDINSKIELLKKEYPHVKYFLIAKIIMNWDHVFSIYKYVMSDYLTMHNKNTVYDIQLVDGKYNIYKCGSLHNNMKNYFVIV